MKNGKRIESITIEKISDNDADISYLTQEGFEDRLAAYGRGDFEFVGIRASASILIPTLCNKGCVKGHEVYSTTAQTITSGGLWGIESDSDESYIKEVESDELAELRNALYSLGFSKRAIAIACKNVERIEA